MEKKVNFIEGFIRIQSAFSTDSIYLLIILGLFSFNFELPGKPTNQATIKVLKLTQK